MRPRSSDSAVHRGVLFAGLVALAVSPGTASADFVTLDVYDNDFGNATTRQHIDPQIKVGDTIRWVFVSGLHSTTSAAGQAESWNSGDRSPPFTFEHTFTRLGTFNYYCDLHGFDAGNGQVSGMSGSIIVSAVPEPSTLVLVGAGLAGAYGFGRRRRARDTASPREP
jgi:plastocyanin